MADGARFEFSVKKTVWTVLIVAILLGLGFWQMDRRVWKQNLIATIDARQAERPVTRIAPDMSGDDYMNLDYRRAELTGLVDETKVVYVGPHTLNNVYGYYQLTPMFLQGGKVILVNQGFVPADWINTPHSKHTQVMALSGTLRLPPQPGLFTPNNPPEGNRFYWVDLLSMGKLLGTQQLVPLVMAQDKLGDAYPIGGQTILTLPNDHLKYALTWFSLAAAMLVVYLVSSFKRHTVIVPMFTMEHANRHDIPANTGGAAWAKPQQRNRRASVPLVSGWPPPSSRSTAPNGSWRPRAT